MPVIAALAGLMVPALIFFLFNPSGDDARAWGVVISTDTAFLVGALAIIGPQCPARLRTFLLTLAVVDDVGALMAIALFYSDHVRLVPLLIALVLIAGIAAVRLLPIGRGPAYSALAFALWLALFLGGVHPTLAGVAVALLIPVFTPERQRVEEAVEVIRAFRQSPNSEYARAASRSLRDSISINERLQMGFGPYVSFLVLPLFALANAGVHLDGATVSAALHSPLTWGVIVGPRRGQVHRDHRCDRAGTCDRNGRSGTGFDAPTHRGWRRPVGYRVHHLAVHHRTGHHGSGEAGPGPRRRPRRRRCSPWFSGGRPSGSPTGFRHRSPWA